MDSDRSPRTLKTVEKTCEILDALKEVEGAGVTELADRLDMSKGGVYNHLATLHDQQYVVKNGDQYELSHRFFNLGEFVKHRDPLYTAGRSEVDRLAKETGESAHLMVEQFGKGTYYYKAQSEKGISQEYHWNLLEETDYLHWTATGKAVMAELPEERIQEIVDTHGLPTMTEKTITELDHLFDELSKIREQGYALNDEEQIRGVRAIGAAVTNHEGVVLGAISVSGPTSRIGEDKFSSRYPELVMQAANIIEVTLDTQGSSFSPDG
jgi:DNA-binding IclR family transcriptional regulator